MNLPDPSQYPRRILLAVSGMSPQILTETLWALSQQRQRAFIPTEVHLLTTQSGARNAQRNLLLPGEGHFLCLAKEYGLDAGIFTAATIHVIRDQQGATLEDIRTPAENEAAADFITDKIRELTGDDNAALHVSMAGGRKTMGYCAGYALSLFGRPQDRLSHVLVSEPFEGLRNFYYPTRDSHLIDTPSGKVLDASHAQVTLAEIPFVRLRDDVPASLLAGKAGFSDTIRQAQRMHEPEHLVVDIARRRLVASGVAITLPPKEFALYAWFVRRHLDDVAEPGSRDFLSANPLLAEEFLTLFARIEGEFGHDIERTRAGMAKGMDNDWFTQNKGRINKALREQLGKTLGERYAIATKGKYGNSHYGLRLSVEQIEWIEE